MFLHHYAKVFFSQNGKKNLAPAQFEIGSAHSGLVHNEPAPGVFSEAGQDLVPVVPSVGDLVRVTFPEFDGQRSPVGC